MIDMQNFQNLLKKKLTRKEFLQVSGLMMLSIIGVRGMLKNIDSSLSHHSKKSDDYGESTYGG